MANTTIFTVPSRTFQSGLTSSPIFTFPVGFTEVDMDLINMAQADLDDLSLTIRLQLMANFGSGFTENNGYTWGGGIPIGKPPATKPPHMAVFNAADLAGLPCRVDATFSRIVTCGILVSGK
jgi:hypothetical protein